MVACNETLVFYMEPFSLGGEVQLSRECKGMASCLWELLLGSPASGRSPHEGALFKALEYCFFKMKDEPLDSNWEGREDLMRREM